ncbi:RHS repeat-associated core domain-containing protein [Kribbella turkmenica]|uniref:RHS repeat-associated core domain-containing protein n=1 Tax=Kribbella turkmenica TaxID=2530375 RepID=UPI00140437F8|nr:RHS repeat-associated core domain-containing protein [Kribbella turkmenica]
MRKPTMRRTARIALAALLASVMGVLTTPLAHAVDPPGEPSIGDLAAQAPEIASPGAGSGQTSEQGDYNYAYPIEVPPGRRGHQPQLALNYSSAGAVHGGVAAGWTLPVPTITVDPAAGSFRAEWPKGGRATQPRNFLGPDGSPLVKDPKIPVSAGGVGYRSPTDPTFTRFEYLGDVVASPHWWVAYGKDGMKTFFGMKNQTPYSYAPIASQVDHTGHRLWYDYAVRGRVDDSPVVPEGHPREILLEDISYESPPVDGQPTATYARITFEHSGPTFCGTPEKLPAVGSKLDYRYGFGLLTGTRKLTAIKTWRHQAGALATHRVYTLAYDNTDNCAAATTTPFRQLASIQQTALAPNTGALTILPPTQFTYGKAAAYVHDSDYTAWQDLPGVRVPTSLETNNLGSEGADCGAPFCMGSGEKGFLTARQGRGERVQVAWIDINGDGRVDQLRTKSPAYLSFAAPATGNCKVETYVNKGSLGFVKDDGFSFSLRDAFADIPVASMPGSDGDEELLCSLSRSYSKSTVGAGGDPNKPCSFGLSWGSMQKVDHGFADLDGDRRPELISRPTASLECPYESIFGRPIYKDNGSINFDDWNGHNDSATITARDWYVYRNTGSGFASTPSIHRIDRGTWPYTMPEKASPPAVTVSGTRHVSESCRAFADVTGDGYPDLGDLFCSRLDASVRPGLSTGERSEEAIELPRTSLRRGAHAVCDEPTCDVEDGVGHHFNGMAADVNGDGLSDVLDFVESKGTKVYFNSGYGWASGAGNPEFFSENAPNTNHLLQMRPVDVSLDERQMPISGAYMYGNQMVDLDYDGLADNLYRDPAANSGKLYLNGGSAWVKVVDVAAGSDDTFVRALGGRFEYASLTEFNGLGDYKMRQTHQAVDLNGDGLLDLARSRGIGVNLEVRYAKPFLDNSADHKAPARLLRTVKNGFGAKTTVSYARQSAAQRWMATEVTTSPGASQPDMTEKYVYKFANFTDGPYGHSLFRGFGEVRSLQVGDSADTDDDVTTVRLYSFNEDYRGVLTRSVTVRGDSAFNSLTAFSPAAQSGVMSVVDQTYDFVFWNILMPGMETTFAPKAALPASTTRYICATSGGQTVDNCLATNLSTREETIWSELAGPDDARVAKLPTRTQMSFVNADGDLEIRRTDRTYNLRWSGTEYNVAHKSTVDSVTVGGTTTELGGVHYEYEDESYFRLHASKVTDPSSDDKITRYAYYAAGVNNGQPGYIWEPEQVRRYGINAPVSKATQLSYDSFGVHVAKATNPVGHSQLFTTDLGTGQVTDVRGPDYVCPDGPDAGTRPDPGSACAFDDALNPERSTTNLDGLGRPISRTVYSTEVGSTAVVFESYTYGDRTYFESGAPVWTKVQRKNGDGLFGSMTTSVDGLGRTVQTSASQSPQPTKTVSYSYNARGLLSTVVGPRADASGVTGVKKTYDPLGRLTTLSEFESGTRILRQYVYSSLSVTEMQWPNGDGAKLLEKTSTMDAAGQLVQIREKAGTKPVGDDVEPIYAYTNYRYDGMGRVSKLSDPDGALTTVTHDYLGNRRSVASAGRTWAYGYDHNNNLTTVVEPVPAGASASSYTHSRTFDDINRVVSYTPAVRDLTETERGQLKHGVTTYAYDNAHPSLQGGDRLFQLGRLSYTSSPVSTVINQYDEYGSLKRTRQNLTALNGLVTADDLELKINTPAGAPTVGSIGLKAFADGATSPSHDGALIAYGYDADGTPSRVSAGLTSGSLELAKNTRNAAGVVTKREANTNNLSGFAKPVVHYGYDKFGRVTQVQEKLGATQRYKLIQSYWSNDHVKQTHIVQGADGVAPAAVMGFQYDNRMQLTQASETGGVGYSGTFTYTTGGRLASANVMATAAARVPTRNATHVYENAADGGDPQRLMALRKPDQSNLATYAHDEAGNMTSRTLPDGTVVNQRWDGVDLRRVSTSNGSEVFFYQGGTRVAAVRYNASGAVQEMRRWFGNAEVLYTPGQSQPKYRQYVALNGEVVARVDGSKTAPAIEYYVTDTRGNHVLSTSATDGSVKRRATYGPFGELLTESRASGTPANKYTKEFNGKDYDPTGGLHYYGSRYYDPLALQWVSADSKYRHAPDANLSAPRRANLYTFSLNNPVSYVDPDGRDPYYSAGGHYHTPDGGIRGDAFGLPAWLTIYPPSITYGGGGSRESGGGPSADLASGQLGGIGIGDGIFTLKVISGGVNVSAKGLGGELQALDAELKVPILETQDLNVLVYGRGRALGAGIDGEGSPSAFKLDGRAGLGATVGDTEVIGYVGAQIGTTPLYVGIQASNMNYNTASLSQKPTDIFGVIKFNYWTTTGWMASAAHSFFRSGLTLTWDMNWDSKERPY